MEKEMDGQYWAERGTDACRIEGVRNLDKRWGIGRSRNAFTTELCQIF